MSGRGTKPVRVPKIVQVTVNSDGTCVPDPARVQQNDKIIWTGAAHELHFPSDNPFDEQQSNKFPPNQHHTVAKLSGRFTYNVTTPSGTYDPDVVVDPPAGNG
jgi:hypothetical protein